MQYKNTSTKYGIVTKIFHWSLALLIIGQLALGLYMVDLPKDNFRVQFYVLHKELGILILALILLRILWRFRNIQPILNISAFERVSAKITYWILYALMLAVPLTGWLFSSAAGKAISFFSLFTVPALIAANDHLKMTFGELHEITSYCLIALLILHILVALKHHFFNKDDILKRML